MGLPPDDPEAAARERRLVRLLVTMVVAIVLAGAGISIVYLLLSGGR